MRRIFTSSLSCIAVIVMMLTSVLTSSAIPARPNPPRLVNDFAGIFSANQRNELENILVAFDDSTSNQITVVTVEDLEGYEPSQYATQIGLEWQVGSSEFNNGIVVLVKPKNAFSSGKVFIATGYGLEGAIPDVYAKRIIDNIMIPHFKTGDYYTGVMNACDVLMQLASGEISEIRNKQEDAPWLAFIVFFIVILGVALIVFAHSDDNDRSSGNRGHRTIYTGPIITSGRSYRGGSFGGGLGGFGGFGGGSFGGGGAGGSW